MSAMADTIASRRCSTTFTPPTSLLWRISGRDDLDDDLSRRRARRCRPLRASADEATNTWRGRADAEGREQFEPLGLEQHAAAGRPAHDRPDARGVDGRHAAASRPARNAFEVRLHDLLALGGERRLDELLERLDADREAVRRRADHDHVRGPGRARRARELLAVHHPRHGQRPDVSQQPVEFGVVRDVDHRVASRSRPRRRGRGTGGSAGSRAAPCSGSTPRCRAGSGRWRSARRTGAGWRARRRRAATCRGPPTASRTALPSSRSTR